MMTVQYGIFPKCVKSASEKSQLIDGFFDGSKPDAYIAFVYKGFLSGLMFPTMKSLDSKNAEE